MLGNELYMNIERMKVNKKKTMSVKELCEEYGLGSNKAYQLIHAKDFPVIFCGKRAIIIRSKLDEWFSNHIGERI
jgi:excisionase family DNA binding protein